VADDQLKGLLSTGEVVLISTRQHWVAAVRFALRPILIFLGGVALWIINAWLDFPSDSFFDFINDVVGWIVIALIVVSIIWLPIDLVRWWSRRYVLTNRRAIRSYGVIRKTSLDTSLEQINDIGLTESFIGRRLGYADLTLYTASNSSNEVYDQLIDGIQFKKAVLDAKEAIRLGHPLEALTDGFVVKGGTNEASRRADGTVQAEAAAMAAAADTAIPSAEPGLATPSGGADASASAASAEGTTAPALGTAAPIAAAAGAVMASEAAPEPVAEPEMAPAPPFVPVPESAPGSGSGPGSEAAFSPEMPPEPEDGAASAGAAAPPPVAETIIEAAPAPALVVEPPPAPEPEPEPPAEPEPEPEPMDLPGTDEPEVEPEPMDLPGADEPELQTARTDAPRGDEPAVESEPMDGGAEEPELETAPMDAPDAVVEPDPTRRKTRPA
jgi:membrane protein YdbS with pleckstrin-like domain